MHVFGIVMERGPIIAIGWQPRQCQCHVSWSSRRSVPIAIPAVARAAREQLGISQRDKRSDKPSHPSIGMPWTEDVNSSSNGMLMRVASAWLSPLRKPLD